MAKTPEIGGVRPAKMRAGGVHLLELRVLAKRKIAVKALEVARALDGCGIAAGIMIAHVHPRLIDVRGPHKRRGVALQHQHTLAPAAAVFGRIQAVQPRAKDDLIVIHAPHPFGS